MFSVDDEAVVDRSSFSSHGILFNARGAATEKPCPLYDVIIVLPLLVC